MPTRNIVLTPEQSGFVEQLVRSGRYQNASEVLRDGLRLVEAREREQEARLEALRRATAEGIADVEAGRYTELDTERVLEAHLQALTEQAIAKR
ncbi:MULTISPECIES: type II toxin-antitoxin system ParD family antitoxin [unclassified Thioalkalivibrio]|uniref:type II toxin-antitoxin system ParD family antitoxin n=1 Tax=unclassified Thioalkalivibrio TaxID=2621013 RepID=UPI0003765145|nr:MULTISPECIES: type II toxin-antitoxin system ParD family antitoxin [unclassified Thioalkalivibrio]